MDKRTLIDKKGIWVSGNPLGLVPGERRKLTVDEKKFVQRLIDYCCDDNTQQKADEPSEVR